MNHLPWCSGNRDCLMIQRSSVRARLVTSLPQSMRRTIKARVQHLVHPRLVIRCNFSPPPIKPLLDYEYRTSTYRTATDTAAHCRADNSLLHICFPLPTKKNLFSCAVFSFLSSAPGTGSGNICHIDPRTVNYLPWCGWLTRRSQDSQVTGSSPVVVIWPGQPMR